MTTCVVCQKREAETGQVCGGDRTGLAAVLRDLVDAYAALSQPEPAAPVLVGVHVVDDGGFDDPRVYDVYELPGGPVRVATGSAPISCSREAPVPITMDVVDLTAPARSGAARDTLVPLVQTRQVDVRVRRVDRVVVRWVEISADGQRIEKSRVEPVEVDETQRRTERAPVHGGYGQPVMVPAGDQIGQLPVATVLDQWVRNWISYPWCPGDHLPVPTVPVLAGWLGDRLELACDRHPAIDDFASEMRQLLHRCRRASGDLPARPEVLVGVPCSSPECDGLLLHQAGDTYWAECDDCGRLWTEDEYREWVALVAAQATRPTSADPVLAA